MSSKKTQNYQLHSWLPSDEFHVSEINENFALLDAALKAEAKSAAQKQTALETALETSLENKPDMVIGTYMGKGAPNYIELGRRPAIVHIEKQIGVRDPYYSYGGLFRETTSTYSSGSITIDDTGFTLSTGTSLNGKGLAFIYVAYFFE
ncbi:MAG: hypothetical protein K2F83_05700 [Oscillospiraceae bacterium]|nr:hypothetical protein [Oscillospiraceae bacterium]